MEFRDKVKTVRKKLFMSQQAFAKELSVTYSTVNRWENSHWNPNYKGQKAFFEFCEKHNIKFDDQNK